MFFPFLDGTSSRWSPRPAFLPWRRAYRLSHSGLAKHAVEAWDLSAARRGRVSPARLRRAALFLPEA
jgi:hypothetical protein